MENVIQVAGIGDQAEAELIMTAGVQWLGFPLRLDVHQTDLSEDEAAAITASLPPHVKAIVITYERQADSILELCEKINTRYVQLHADLAATELHRLRHLNNNLFILKSIVVGHPAYANLSLTLDSYIPFVDAFITDTYDPASGASGATGKQHDWNMSRRIVAESPRPVILAGGLTPENVYAAIEQVHPAGVDTHTGVEDEQGRKDPVKLRRFVAAAQAAFQQYSTPPLPLRQLGEDWEK